MGYVNMQDVRALWQTMRFLPVNLVINNLNTGCSAVLLCAAYVPHPASPNIPHPSNPNRWSVVFILNSGVHLRFEVIPSVATLAFVKIDVVPNSLARQTFDPRVVFCVPLDFQEPRPTVMDIFQTLITNGLHQFSFTPNGRGQRQWIRSFVYHLELDSILQNRSLETVDEHIHREWWRGTAIRDAPVVAGRFYACYGCETGQRQYCDHEATYPWAMTGMRRRQPAFR